MDYCHRFLRYLYCTGVHNWWLNYVEIKTDDWLPFDLSCVGEVAVAAPSAVSVSTNKTMVVLYYVQCRVSSHFQVKVDRANGHTRSAHTGKGSQSV